MIKTHASTFSYQISSELFSGERVGDTNRVVAAILTGSWLQLLSDSPLDYLKYGTMCQKPKRVFTTFYWSLIHDFRFQVRRFSDLGDSLLAFCQNPALRTTASTGEFLKKFQDTPVYPEVLYFLKTESKTVFQYLLSFLYFGKKVEIEDDSLHATALRKWMEVEDRLDSLSEELQRGIHADLLQDLHDILAVVLPEPSGADFFPHHGPGAVNGPQRGDIDKSLALTMNPKIQHIWSNFSPLMGGRLEQTENLAFIKARLLSTKQSPYTGNTSKLMFVMKNNKTSRSICEEPTEVMFAQQGIRALLEKAITDGPLGRNVHLKDQSFNQSGALFGSATGLVDTIDLSAASDSVHLDVVKAVFPRPWVQLLLASRTSQVELPDGTVKAVKKFAPMGSAVCFPTQCILYAAMTLLAYIRYMRPHHQGRYNADLINDVISEIPTTFRRSIVHSWAVYGDDIICDCRVTDELISILQTLKFDVNITKSYYGLSQFRESCGVYALSGIDVTPLIPHLRHTVSLHHCNPEFLSSLVSITNRAGDFGYHQLQRYLITVVKSIGRTAGGPRILFAREGYGSRELPSLTIYSANPSNSHLKKRFNKDLQRIEFRHSVVIPRNRVTADSIDEKRRPSWDAYSYSMHWRACNMRGQSNDDDFITPRVVSYGTTLGWVWTPAED